MRGWSLHSVTLPHMENTRRGYPVRVLPIPIQRFLEGLVCHIGLKYQEPCDDNCWKRKLSGASPPANKCPTCPQCPCPASYAMMCGV